MPLEELTVLLVILQGGRVLSPQAEGRCITAFPLHVLFVILFGLTGQGGLCIETDVKLK
jgi:hypothetical protein